MSHRIHLRPVPPAILQEIWDTVAMSEIPIQFQDAVASHLHYLIRWRVIETHEINSTIDEFMAMVAED